METVAERIRYLRKVVFDKTQEGLAKEFGVTRNAVTLWEKDGQIADENAAKLVEKAATTRDWLRAGIGERPTREAYLLRVRPQADGDFSGRIDWRAAEAAVAGGFAAIAWLQGTSARELAEIVLSNVKDLPYGSLDDDKLDKIRNDAMESAYQFLTQLRDGKHQPGQQSL